MCNRARNRRSWKSEQNLPTSTVRRSGSCASIVHIRIERAILQYTYDKGESSAGTIVKRRRPKVDVCTVKGPRKLAQKMRLSASSELYPAGFFLSIGSENKTILQF
jgi:hypothetical protein